MLNYKYSHYVSIIGRIFVYFINFAINLEDMSNFIKDYYRRKRLKDSAHLNIGTFTNLKDVESVSFAYGIESPADIADVIEIFKFLKWRSVKIRALVIETKKGVFDKIEESFEIISWFNRYKSKDPSTSYRFTNIKDRWDCH